MTVTIPRKDVRHGSDPVREARHQWTDTVDAIRDPIMVHDGEGRIVRANRAYAELAGVGFPQLLGRRYWDCFPKADGPLPGCGHAACVAQQGKAREIALPGGTLYTSNVFPLRDDGSGMPRALHLFRNVTRDRRDAQAQMARSAKAVAHAEALAALASSAALAAGDVPQLAREMTEKVSRACNVARVNIWLFNAEETALACVDHFDASTGTHSSGMELQQAQFENEFRALKAEPFVAADHPLTDPRTAGYAEGYLKPNRITSMLDVVVEISGRHLGLLCLEHVDQAHPWEDDEIAFARQAAEKIAIAIANRGARQAEQALRLSEERFRTIFEQAPVGISESSVTGSYLNANRRLCEITGYSLEELRARRFSDITHPDDIGRDKAALADLLAGRKATYATEKRYLRKDGTIAWVSLLVTPVRDAGGAIQYLFTIADDITGRKANEAEIRALARFPEENPNAVMRMSADGLVLYANPASLPLQTLCGAAPGARVRGHFADVVRASLASGEKQEIEIRDGERIFAVTVTPIARESYANIYGSDVTERRRAEHALRASKDLLESIVENAPMRVFWKDANLRFLGSNSAFARDAGLSKPADLIGKDDTHMTWHTQAGKYRADDRQVMASGTPKLGFEEQQTTADGRTAWVRTSKVPLREAGGKVFGVLGIYEDITERKQAEDELKRLNWAMQALSQSNSSLVHAGSERELFENCCKAIVSAGAYPLAWIGLARDDPERSVELAASAGEALAYVEGLKISWADSALGNGPTGIAIRTNATQVIGDFAASAGFAPWRARARQNGLVGSISLPIRLAGKVIGALMIYSKQPQGFTRGEIELFEALAEDLGYGISARRVRDAYDASVQEQTRGAARLRKSLEDSIGAIAATVEMRDPYTAGHERRVGELATAIATEMGLSAAIVEGIHFGSLIHDLGKIRVPAEILSKPTRLTPIEFALVKEHPQAGFDIIKDIDFPWPVAQMVLQHHERLDGSGYPQGLKGDQILLEARVLAVADTIEAMSSHRPYRPGLGIEKALAEIQRGSGTAYDAPVVDACLRLFREKGFSLDGARP